MTRVECFTRGKEGLVFKSDMVSSTFVSSNSNIDV